MKYRIIKERKKQDQNCGQYFESAQTEKKVVLTKINKGGNKEGEIRLKEAKQKRNDGEKKSKRRKKKKEESGNQEKQTKKSTLQKCVRK